MKRVGIVGVGKRVQTLYAPALRALSPEISVVGFVRRSAGLPSEVARDFKAEVYPTIEALNTAAKPDFLLLVVSPDALTAAALEAVRLHVPFLVETPFVSADVVNRASAAGLIAGVLEQMPFYPIEELKAKLISAGILGRVLFAQNDFRGYEYHGMAMIRRSIGLDAAPLSVLGSAHSNSVRPFLAANGVEQRVEEHWLHGAVDFDNGTKIVFNGTNNYSRLPFRGPRSLRVYCEGGTLTNEGLDSLEIRGVWNGHTFERIVHANRSDSGEFLSACATLPDGLEIRVERPGAAPGLTDDQLAIRAHIKAFADACASRGRPLYTLRDGYLDTALLEAMRRSAQSRSVIKL